MAATDSATRLVRGIHEIPPSYEMASASATIRECVRAATSLRRLADKADKDGRDRDARTLRCCAAAVEGAADHITGWFDVARMEREVAKMPQPYCHGGSAG